MSYKSCRIKTYLKIWKETHLWIGIYMMFSKFCFFHHSKFLQFWVIYKCITHNTYLILSRYGSSRPYFRRSINENVERESPQKVPQVSVELLGGQVTNVKFQLLFKCYIKLIGRLWSLLTQMWVWHDSHIQGRGSSRAHWWGLKGVDYHGNDGIWKGGIFIVST